MNNNYDYCEVATCTGEDLWCLGRIRVTEEDCPNKCEGLIVGVRKDSVTRLHKVQTSVLRVYHRPWFLPLKKDIPLNELISDRSLTRRDIRT